MLGLGYLFGKIALGSFKLGAVTGTLLAGVLVGQLGVTLPNEVKQCFFLLFLFAIGFRTGPQFFRGLKSDGLAHAALAAIVATTGLLVAWVVAVLFGYDAGTGAGLVAGALTESATIGTAMDAIASLDLAEAERTALSNNIPVAFAVTYLVGVTVAAWVLSQLAPKLLRVDLAEECRKLEEQMQGGAVNQASARREFEFRGYAVDPGSRFVGRSIAELESAVPGARFFVEQVRSGGQIVAARDVKALKAGDIIAVSGRRTILVEVLEAPGSGLREVDDRELLEVPSDVVDVVVTNKTFDGRTLADIGRDEVSRGIFLRRITRGGTDLGMLPDTRVNRGDVLTVVGSAAQHGASGRGSGRGRSPLGRDGHGGRSDRHRRRCPDRPAGARNRWRRDRSQPAGRRAARRTGLRLAAFREAGPVRARAGSDAVDLRVDRAHWLRGGGRPERGP